MSARLASVLEGPNALPRSHETERAVLSCVLLDSKLLMELPIWADLFDDARNRELLAAIAELQSEGEPIDERTLLARLEFTGKLEAAGGLVYLAGLNLDLPDLGRVNHYVRILEALRLRREMAALGGWITRSAIGSAGKAEDLIADAQSRMLEIIQGQSRRLGAAESLGSVALEQAERYANLESGQVTGVPTGLPDLDKVLGGFEPGRLIVIAGRPGMGKSTLAQQIAEFQQSKGFEQLVISLEMTTPEYATRSLVRRTGISYDRMRSGWTSTEQRKRILQAAQEVLREGDIKVNDTAGMNLAQIAFEARSSAAAKGLRTIWVDHIGLVQKDRGHENRALEIAAYSRALKNLAKDLGITVVALSQLNRECEKRNDKRPMLSDLRDSGSIEQDADSVIFVHRPEFYWPNDESLQGAAELIVAKNRDGVTGTVDVVWLGERMEFRSLERRHER